jgi:hypothetical protein
MNELRPHLILYNGRIRTLDPGLGVVSAVAIANEVVLACGEDHSVQGLAVAATQCIDLQGRTVLPGLIDAHIHLELYAQSLARLDCETATLAECLERIVLRTGEAPPGTWILGHGWNQNVWGRYGALHELDAAAPRHPVFLTAKSLHAAWANSQALALANLDANSSDPPGGTLGRDSEGGLNGLLFEAATALVNDRLPKPDAQALAEDLATAQRRLWACGITGVHDFDGAHCLTALQLLRESGRLGLRVLKNLQLESLRPALELGLRSGFGDDWLRIGNLKLFADGALGPRTAAMIEDYDHDTGNRGQLLLDVEAITDTGALARAGGISLAIHAIGDLANHHALQAVARLNHLGAPPALPYRLEHLQLLHAQDFMLAAEAGVIASMQPIHAPSDSEMADRYWGRRTAQAYAWRTFDSLRVPLAFGSDAPVESPNPFWGLHAAVVRQRPDGTPWHPELAVDLETALRAYTLGPALAAGMGQRQGKLSPGSLGDLIVLERDPLTAPLDALRDMRPVGVLVGGVWRLRSF